MGNNRSVKKFDKDGIKLMRKGYVISNVGVCNNDNYWFMVDGVIYNNECQIIEPNYIKDLKAEFYTRATLSVKALKESIK